MFDNDDNDIFIEEFGQNVVFTLSDNTSLPIKGIFDNPAAENSMSELSIVITQPQLTCKTSDIANVKKGNTVVINSKTYSVSQKPIDDGTGMSLILLDHVYITETPST